MSKISDLPIRKKYTDSLTALIVSGWRVKAEWNVFSIESPDGRYFAQARIDQEGPIDDAIQMALDYLADNQD